MSTTAFLLGARRQTWWVGDGGERASVGKEPARRPRHLCAPTSNLTLPPSEAVGRASFGEGWGWWAELAASPRPVEAIAMWRASHDRVLETSCVWRQWNDSTTCSIYCRSMFPEAARPRKIVVTAHRHNSIGRKQEAVADGWQPLILDRTVEIKKSDVDAE